MQTITLNLSGVKRQMKHMKVTKQRTSVLSMSVLKMVLTSSIIGIGLLAASTASAVTVDKGIPEYKAVSGISGNLSSVGSDTLANLMTLWAETFKRYYPNVNIQIQAAGSSTAPPALTEATSSFGNFPHR